MAKNLRKKIIDGEYGDVELPADKSARPSLTKATPVALVRRAADLRASLRAKGQYQAAAKVGQAIGAIKAAGMGKEDDSPYWIGVKLDSGSEYLSIPLNDSEDAQSLIDAMDSYSDVTVFAVDEYGNSEENPFPQGREFELKGRYVNSWLEQIYAELDGSSKSSRASFRKADGEVPSRKELINSLEWTDTKEGADATSPHAPGHVFHSVKSWENGRGKFQLQIDSNSGVNGYAENKYGFSGPIAHWIEFNWDTMKSTRPSLTKTTISPSLLNLRLRAETETSPVTKAALWNRYAAALEKMGGGRVRKGAYPTVTLEMNSMGHVEMWRGEDTSGEADVYFQAQSDVEALKDSLTADERDDLDNGYPVVTTNISDEYFGE